MDGPQLELVDPPDIPLPSDFGDDDAIVLPREIGEDGHGLYDDSVLTIAKEFRSQGVHASYQHDPESRDWIGEYGVSPLVLDLVIGIASNAGWAALCWLLVRNHGADSVRVRVGRFTKTKEETSATWYSIKGPGAEVAKALAEIEAPEGGVQAVEEEKAQAAIAKQSSDD
jgi:hypothetical protein